MYGGHPIRIIGAVCGLSAFAIALIGGMAAGNLSSTTVLRALIAMLACRFIGQMLATIGLRTVNEYLDAYRMGRPEPDVEALEREVERPPEAAV